MSQGKNENAQTNESPWTVLRLLQWTTDFFRSKECDSPRLDAEILLAHAMSCTRVELYTSYAKEPSDEERVAFREMVRRRGNGMPVAQIVGYREFYSLSFRVSEATLIPRPETEHLIVEALDCAANLTDKTDCWIADIGTGSGVIAVTLAKQLPKSRIVATDISEAAIEIAAWNAEQHEVDQQIRFVKSDLFDQVEEPARFSMICSNPPYISESEYLDLSPTVREFEPKSALVAGEQGTEIISRIVQSCESRLLTGGHCIVELSPMIAEACMELADKSKLFEKIHFIKDLAGHRRILSMCRR